MGVTGNLEILVQRDLSEPLSRKVFAKISTEVLSLEDIVRSLSNIIDDEELGYHRLPFMNASSKSLQRLDVYTSLRRERADKAFIVSNGKNTIYMLNYVVKAQRIYHDPVLCIVGPEAEKIGQSVLEKLSRLLLSKMYSVKFEDEAVVDFSNLTGYKKSDVIKKLSETFEEAELALKMKLLRKHNDKMEPLTLRSGLSTEIIEDMKPKPLARDPHGLESIIPFGIIVTVMILLLIILMRL